MDTNVFAKSDEIPSLPVHVTKEKPKCRGLRITKGNNSKRIGPYFSIINVHLVDTNVFAKYNDIPTLPVQVIKEKPKCRGLRITKGKNFKRIAPKPYLAIINVHLVDTNVFAKFYEIPSLPFQDIEKPKRRGQTDWHLELQRAINWPLALIFLS